MAYAELIISGTTFEPASLYGVTQTLDPIAETIQIRRDINGLAHDISAPQFRKYKSTIACSGQIPPTFNDLWPGAILTIDCIAELAYATATETPTRTVVASRVDGAVTFYRPQLTMILLSYSMQKDEWGAVVSWQMELEEQ